MKSRTPATSVGPFVRWFSIAHCSFAVSIKRMYPPQAFVCPLLRAISNVTVAYAMKPATSIDATHIIRNLRFISLIERVAQAERASSDSLCEWLAHFSLSDLRTQPKSDSISDHQSIGQRQP